MNARSPAIVAMLALLMIAGCKRSAARQPKQVAAGALSSCRLDAGSVTCWGDGGPNNTLGMGKPDHLSGARLPNRVVDLADATQISVGLSTACALKRDATVVCWGIDWSTALPGVSNGVDRPMLIAGLTDITEVSAGRSHVCALHKSGEVSCWGDNNASQVGVRMRVVSDVVQRPTRVFGISDAVHVTAGEESTCVVHRDGGVSCWGRTAQASGANAARDPHVPQRLSGLAKVKSVAVGNEFVCGLLENTEVWCSGKNNLGQLGLGDVEPHPAAVQAKAPAGTRSIVASHWSTCALGAAGEVTCWGQLPPIPGQEPGARGPSRVPNLPKANNIALSSLHGCAVSDDGEVWCWGSGARGETGFGSTDGAHGPRRVEL